MVKKYILQRIETTANHESMHRCSVLAFFKAKHDDRDHDLVHGFSPRGETRLKAAVAFFVDL